MSGMMQVPGIEADWRCVTCCSYNRGGHRMCTTCEKWRDLDWSCAMCGFKNFAKRDTCKSCGAGNVIEEDPMVTGGGGGSYYTSQEAGGEWVGGKSGTSGGYQDPYSSAPDTSFSQTSSYQSTGAAVVDPVNPVGAQELPWLCGLCKCENAPQKILCFECSGHRERVEVRNRAAESRLNIMGGLPAKQPSHAMRALSNPRHMSPMSDLTRVQYRPGGPVEDQSQDWNCGNCQNRNFAKRSKCNKCSKPRSEVEEKRNFVESSWDMPPAREEVNYRSAPRGRSGMMTSYQEPPPMIGARPEDRTQDWKCSECDNRNFARRKECNKCKKPRDEVEDKDTKFDNEELRVPMRKRSVEPIMMFNSKQMRFDDRREDLSKDWVCGNCDINCFAKKTHCFRCNKPREEVENKNTSAVQFERPMVSYPFTSTPRISGHNLQINTGHGERPGRFSQVEERPRKKWVDEDTSNDWNCQICDINNFAKRKTCFKCRKAREECELKKDDREAEEINNINAENNE